MKHRNILVIGGYGSVGFEVVKLLSDMAEFNVFVAGRDTEKAKKVASIFHCKWKYVDVTKQTSIDDALEGVDTIINCFVSIDRTDVSVAESSVSTRLKYTKF